MKKYRWNREKFKENIAEPIIGILVFVGLGVVWI